MPAAEKTDDYYADDYYSSDADYFLNEDEQVVHTTPEFKSEPVNTMVNEGDTIKLPCFVDKLGKFSVKVPHSTIQPVMDFTVK